MSKLPLSLSRALTLFAVPVFVGWNLLVVPAKAQPDLNIQPASDEGVKAIRGFELPEGFICELFAAEPMFANPVSFCIDEQGKFYVAETFRFGKGVVDIRGRMHWLDTELASQSVEERNAYTARFEGDKVGEYTKYPDRISVLWDSNGDGKADQSKVFAGEFNEMADGIGSGLLARGGDVYYANIPNLWLLQDKDGDHQAETRRSLSYGYGIRFGFLGHDSHGLRSGPDGRLYFSIGDRGAHIELPDGRVVKNHEAGAVYRCELDGSGLEIFHIGLRNPQELAFDDLGNLWTVDNNSDAGDPARVVYVAEQGDSGWRIGWQFRETPMRRSSWLGERLCYEYFRDRAAYCLPPVSSKVGNGPSGLVYDPGIGLTDEWKGRFFLCNFSGNPNSGIYSFAVDAWGAGFQLRDNQKFVWNFLPTDVEFGHDGAIYASDWVNGWSGLGKGRIYRIYHPVARAAAAARESQTLFAEGFSQRNTEELGGLLNHPNRRVRQEAQFALVGKGGARILQMTAERGSNSLARLHGVWGLGQLARQGAKVDWAKLLAHQDPEVRAQTLKVIGDARDKSQVVAVRAALQDSVPRVRYFAALAAGKLGDAAARPDLLALLQQNQDRDPWLRHAGIRGLLGTSDAAALAALKNHQAAAVRLAAVVALRDSGSPALEGFLQDPDPRVVAEAARAINDLPVVEALPQLAALAGRISDLAALPGGTGTEPAPRDAILRRVVNANFRVGTREAATAVGRIAANEALPEMIRIEAITALGEWARPDGKDRVSGLWRPLEERAAPETSELEPIAAGLLTDKTPAQTLVALLETAQTLAWKSLSDPAFALLANDRLDRKARVAALNYLGNTRSSRLKEAVMLAREDKNRDVRGAASKFAILVATGAEAVGLLKESLAGKELGEQQAAFAALADIQVPEADQVFVTWLDRLLAGKVAGGLKLDLIEASRARAADAVKQRLVKYEKALPDPEENLDAWLECLEGGDAEKGKKIFLERIEVSCMRCHKLNGSGGEAGPDLTGVGKRADRRHILESVLFPNAKITEGFATVNVNLKNGGGFSGIVKKETDTVLTLVSPEDGAVDFKKADIASRTTGLSGMPPLVKVALKRREIRDLVEFLASQKQDLAHGE